MNHLEVSERVAGLVVFGGINPDAVNVGTLAKPYNQVVLEAQNWKGDQEELAKHLYNKFGWSTIKAIDEARRETIEGPEMNWLAVLEEKARNAELGHTLGTLSKKLKKGQDVDKGKVFGILQTLQEGDTGFVRMSDVDPEKEPWQPSHYPPIDTRIGGYPKGGLIVCGAAPGSGKTSLAIRLLMDGANHGKKVAFFSLEMMLTFIVMRALELSPDISEEAMSRILMDEEVMGIQEIYAKATRLKAQHPDLSLIVIDFADLIVEKEQSEQVMGRIYIQLSVLAKRLGIPIFLLAQLSRRYEGGVPQATHIRYSGLAEAMASVIMLLWNPEGLWADMGQSKKDTKLDYQPGYAYQIVAKSRYGTRMGGLGAIMVGWDGETGWSRDDHHWQELMI